MHPILRNILAIVAGLVIGSTVNMTLIKSSALIIPPPDGADLTTSEGLKAAMHLFEPMHFIFPFLAHALGTFFGAFVAAIVADNNKFKFAMAIVIFFLAGGIASVFMLPSPVWYTIVDLVFAYLPMAYLAYRLAPNKTTETIA